MVRSILNAAAFLAAGLAVGLIVRAALPIGSGRVGMPRGGDSKPEGLPSGPGETELASQEGGRRVTPPEKKPASGQEELLRVVSELIALVPSDPAGEGRGVISGTVVTEFAEPLPGVRVRLEHMRGRWPAPERFGWRPFGEGSIEDWIFTYVSGRKTEIASTRERFTDDKGSFRFEGLAEDAEYRIGAFLVGWDIRPFADRTSLVRLGDRIEFLARKFHEGRVSFTCLLPDGTEPERASVWIGPHSSALDWRPDARAFGFEDGAHIVRAEAEVAEVRYSSDPVVVFAPREEAEPIVLRLRPRPGIYGEVILPPGMSLYAVSVSATPVARAERPEDPDSDEYFVAYASSHHGFRYCAEDLAPGLYYVAAFWPSCGSLLRGVLGAEAFVEVRDERVRQDLELRPPDLRSGFTVRAYAPGGEELAQSEFWVVSLHSAWRDPSGKVERRPVKLKCFREESGTLWYFPGRIWEPPAGGTLLCYLLKVHGARRGGTEVPIDAERDREVAVRFEEEPRASVEISIENFGRTSYRQGTLAVRLETSIELVPGVPREFDYSSSVDREGRAVLSARPGRHQLTITWHPGPEEWQFRRVVHRSTVELRSGANRISVALAPVYDLVVTCPGAEGGEELMLSEPGEVRSWPVRLSTERRAVFPGLPEGTYTLRMEGPRGGEMDVTVPGPEVVEFRPAPFNAFWLDWPREGSYLAEAGFYYVRRIVGVGAELFEDARDFRKILEAAAGEEEIYVLVEEGGKRRAIAVDPRRFLAEIDRPGVLVPIRRR